MSLSAKDVQKIAHLARIAITPDEMISITEDLSKILDFVEVINSADTQQVEPLAHPFTATQPLRSDQITEANQRELFLSNAPEVKAGLFIVPTVIESE